MIIPKELFFLKPLIEGLTYPSESDRPFELVHFPPAASVESVLPKVKEEVSVEEFFGELQDADSRYVELRGRLLATFADLKVFRVGQRKVHIYLLGRLADGSWGGLHTVSIET